ncbi:hypothetical protein [Novosphingobium sp.]|uniref:hypothetical protein n=1 Tax=Novosphingobium sp. TaxID=1874826 RepID=UPI00352AAD4E
MRVQAPSAALLTRRQVIFRITIDNPFADDYPAPTAGHPVTHRIEILVTDMKIHSVFALALGLVALPAAAHAADPAPAAAPAAAPEIKGGELVWSADGRRIGRVDRVRGDTVAVISDMAMVYIPIATLSASEHGLVSTLTRKEIERL